MSVKKIATLGMLLAIMLVFQILKGISPYITGPIVNLVLIVTTYYFGVTSGILFSIIAPVTSFLISPSPILTKLPIEGAATTIAFIALGNIVLCIFIHLLRNKNITLNLFVASTFKALFMGVTISLIILPYFTKGSALPENVINTAKFSFSIMQLITAYIASFISVIAIKTLKIKK